MSAWHAAVAIVVASGERGDEILLIRRATVRGDPWSGHIALPGGAFETSDLSLEATARRETREETGIDLSGSECVARLATVTPALATAPRVTVAPFVFSYGGARAVYMSEEVAEFWWVPVAELRRAESWQQMSVEVGGKTIQALGYSLRGHALWGLTERIIREFLSITPGS